MNRSYRGAFPSTGSFARSRAGDTALPPNPPATAPITAPITAPTGPATVRPIAAPVAPPPAAPTPVETACALGPWSTGSTGSSCLRGVSTGGGSIVEFMETSIRFRMRIGLHSSHGCRGMACHVWKPPLHHSARRKDNLHPARGDTRPTPLLAGRSVCTRGLCRSQSAGGEVASQTRRRCAKLARASPPPIFGMIVSSTIRTPSSSTLKSSSSRAAPFGLK